MLELLYGPVPVSATSIHKLELIRAEQYASILEPCGDRLSFYRVTWLVRRGAKKLDAQLQFIRGGFALEQELVCLGDAGLRCRLAADALCQHTRLCVDERIVHEVELLQRYVA